MNKEVNIITYKNKKELFKKILFDYVDEDTEDPVFTGQMFRLLYLLTDK